MNRRASRLASLVSVSAILAALVIGPAGVQARNPVSTDRQVRTTDPTRQHAGLRPARHVDVASLPESTGDRPVYDPNPARPAGFGAAAPDIQGVVPVPVLATSNGDPAIDQATAFDGLVRSKGATDGEPPDPFVAVGPEHVAQAVNTAFRFSNRAGQAIETVDMFEFFGLANIPEYQAYVFDPRIIYDSLHARWVAIEVSFDCYPVTDQSLVGTGYIDIAISDGPDPTAGWGIISLVYPDAVPDYPGLGTSTDKVVVSANVFEIVPLGLNDCTLGGFLGTEMDVMAWSELMGIGDVYVSYLYSTDSFPNNYFSWRPALQTPAISNLVFAIAEENDEGVAYARIMGSPAGGGSVSITIWDLTFMGVVAPFALPPPPAQPGSPATIADAVDARPTDAVWKDNALAFVSTYPCDPPGGASGARDCVRATELSTVVPGAPTLVQDFLIAEDATDLYMGGIGYASNGDLHAVWTRSSAAAGAYPSTYAAYQAATAAVNTISTRALISPGTGTYPGVRWGDYVGVAQDPQVPNAVWQGDEYSVGLINYWETEVTQLQTGGSSYTAIEPVRVLDSRPAFEIGLVGVFAANIPRTFEVAGSDPDIPANAIAVTGNLTVANQTAAGYVSVTPTAIANPPSSTINFPLGDTRANNVTVPLAADGTLAAVFKAPAGRSTHLIFDVTGYYLPGSADATYNTITPLRVLDTRPAYNIGLTGAFAPNIPRTLTITSVSGPVPVGAVAITGNLTVVGQTRAGYLAITPDPNPTPLTSTLNFPVGDVRANGVSVPLNSAGQLSIVYKSSGGSTHVILDVTGYYLEDPSGLLFYPLTPGRLMDTRAIAVLSGLSGPFAANSPRTLPTEEHWGVPLGAEAITGNLTVVGQTYAGYAAITPTSNANPTTSTINFPLGDIRANGVAVPLGGSGDIFLVYKAPGGKATHLILDLSGYFK